MKPSTAAASIKRSLSKPSDIGLCLITITKNYTRPCSAPINKFPLEVVSSVAATTRWDHWLSFAPHVEQYNSRPVLREPASTIDAIREILQMKSAPGAPQLYLHCVI